MSENIVKQLLQLAPSKIAANAARLFLDASDEAPVDQGAWFHLLYYEATGYPNAFIGLVLTLIDAESFDIAFALVQIFKTKYPMEFENNEDLCLFCQSFCLFKLGYHKEASEFVASLDDDFRFWFGDRLWTALEVKDQTSE